jgi:CheY-like chemotaxis protein
MSKTVLVVDDDVDLRDCLCCLLEREGYSAVGANNGLDALGYLGTNAMPCIILLDLMMPVMSGWDFLDVRRNDKRLARVPVVVVSAIADLKFVSVQGASALMNKPTSFDSILEVIRVYCGRPN